MPLLLPLCVIVRGFLAGVTFWFHALNQLEYTHTHIYIYALLERDVYSNYAFRASQCPRFPLGFGQTKPPMPKALSGSLESHVHTKYRCNNNCCREFSSFPLSLSWLLFLANDCTKYGIPMLDIWNVLMVKLCATNAGINPTERVW